MAGAVALVVVVVLQSGVKLLFYKRCGCVARNIDYNNYTDIY